MRAAVLVFCHALAVAWLAPALLTRLTAHGIGARLGLAAWLAAMASVLASAVVSVARRGRGPSHRVTSSRG